MGSIEEFLNNIKDVLGDRVYRDLNTLDKYSIDWWPLASLLKDMGLMKQKPLAVILPESAEELSYIVKLANRYDVCLTIYSGGSSVTGSSIPDSRCVTVALSRMNRVVEINEEDLYITVEAGIVIADLERELNNRGYTTRYSPQSIHLATIGGSISTMGIGMYSTMYGGIEDIVINLEVVSPQGEIFWTRNVLAPRSSMGPDVKYLYIGSEGVLGIITKATLKIIPKPPHQIKGGFEIESFEKGIKAFKKLITRGLTPAVARVSDEAESRLRFNSDKPILILSYEGYDHDILELQWRRAREIIESFGGKFLGEEPYIKWLEARYRYREEIEMINSMGLWFETFDISTSWSKLAKAYRSIVDAVENIDNRAIVFTHASHFNINGGALYFTILYNKDPEVYWKITNTVLNKALESGATLSHHHGVGLMRAKWLNKDPGKHVANMLRSIKRTLDPKNILNPHLSFYRSE